MCVSIEHDRVRLHVQNEFVRPTRLTHGEALAVQLGLRCLAAEAEPERRVRILQLAARIEAELVTPRIETVHELRDAIEGMRDTEVEYEPEDQELLLGFNDDVLRGVLSEAIAREHTVILQYLKPGAQAPEARRVGPLQLAYNDGYWYLLGFDLERRAPRIFRLDRTLDAAVEAEHPPAEARDRAWIARIAEQGPAPYLAAADVPARVRYSPAIGRWIAERTGAAPEADGSVVIEHRVASPDWLVRHVLKYGGEACVEEPAELRTLVARVAAQIA
jgi:predicted DNA-binding transcriptional regulator YafY